MCAAKSRLRIAFLLAVLPFLYYASFANGALRWCILAVPFSWATILLELNGTAGKRVSKLAWSMVLAASWAAGTSLWLALLYWLWQTPWWSAVVWIASALALGAMWPMLLLFSLQAMRRYRLPVWLAMPIVWCGLDWMRKYWLLGGFSHGSIEHAIYEYPLWIQIADTFGEYGIGFAINLWAASLATVAWQLSLRSVGAPACGTTPARWFPWGLVFLVPLAIYIYGRGNLASEQQADGHRGPTARFALIQGAVEIIGFNNGWGVSRSFEQCNELTKRIGPSVDIVVWPEASCGHRILEVESGYVPENWLRLDAESAQARMKELIERYEEPFEDLARENKTTLIMNVVTRNYYADPNRSPENRNSAIFVSPSNGVHVIYDKRKLVPFAERIPFPTFARWIGAESLFVPGDDWGTPLRIPVNTSNPTYSGESEAKTRKENPNHIVASVHICFDATFSRHIRSQVATQSRKDQEPDVLIGISNTGSWRYPALADMHLATQVFRAIENRKPYLASTNCGYAAWINEFGSIVCRGNRGSAEVVVAEVGRSRLSSRYRKFGNVLPIFCVGFVIIVVCQAAISKIVSRVR